MESIKDNYKIKLDYGKEIEDILIKTHLGKFDEYYNTNIIFNPYIPEKIQLQIFYNSGNYLFEKLEYILQENINLINGISLYNKYESLPYASLDLSESKFLNLNDDDCVWENGFRFVLIEIDKLKISHKYNTANEDYAVFSLNENAINPIDLQYNYNLFNYNNPEKLEAINKQEFIFFGGFYFRLEFDFHITYFYKDKIKIKSVPCLKIRKDSYVEDNYSHDDLINYSNILCLLLSLYYKREIDFFYSKIYQPDNVLTYIKQIALPSDFSKPSIFSENYQSFYYFIKDCDYSKIDSNFNFASNIVSKLILSSRLDSVSEFMILYNILELIRNFYLPESHKKIIKEKYSFTKNDKEVNALIKSKLNDIAKIIIIEEKNNFVKTINNKVEFLKRMSMGNQFSSFFEHLEINIDKTYSLNLAKIIKLRNVIFHGSLVMSELENINTTNKNLRKLINNLIIHIVKHQTLN